MQCELWEVAFACGSKESEKEAALVITTCIKVILREAESNYPKTQLNRYLSRMRLRKDDEEIVFKTSRAVICRLFFVEHIAWCMCSFVIR